MAVITSMITCLHNLRSSYTHSVKTQTNSVLINDNRLKEDALSDENYKYIHACSLQAPLNYLQTEPQKPLN